MPTWSRRDSAFVGRSTKERGAKLKTNIKNFVRLVIRHFALTGAFVLAGASAVAAPNLYPLSDTDLKSTQSCRFLSGGSAAGQGRTVLQWGMEGASMRVDGRLVSLTVEEQNCGARCVAPGRSGVRVFKFSGSGVSATLEKAVSCHKDSESCGGIPEGTATLSVSTSEGHTVATVWGEYCDF